MVGECSLTDWESESVKCLLGWHECVQKFLPIMRLFCTVFSDLINTQKTISPPSTKQVHYRGVQRISLLQRDRGDPAVHDGCSDDMVEQEKDRREQEKAETGRTRRRRGRERKEEEEAGSLSRNPTVFAAAFYTIFFPGTRSLFDIYKALYILHDNFMKDYTHVFVSLSTCTPLLNAQFFVPFQHGPIHLCFRSARGLKLLSSQANALRLHWAQRHATIKVVATKAALNARIRVAAVFFGPAAMRLKKST